MGWMDEFAGIAICEWSGSLLPISSADKISWQNVTWLWSAVWLVTRFRIALWVNVHCACVLLHRYHIAISFYLTLCLRMAFSDERAAAAIYLLFDEEDDLRRKDKRWWVGLICENREKEGSPTTNLYVYWLYHVCTIVCQCVSTIVKKLAFICHIR